MPSSFRLYPSARWSAPVVRLPLGGRQFAALGVQPIGPQEPHAPRKIRVAGYDHAAVAGAADDLAWREREERGISERSGWTATVRRAQRQRRVLDHQQIVAPGDLDDRIELGG